MSKEKLNIYEKIAELRNCFQNMEMKKSGYNKFSKFYYFELQDFLPKVIGLEKELGLYSKFDLLENKAILIVINTETPQEREIFSTPKASALSKGQLEIQGLGSQHTYLKRYLYLNYLNLTENDTVDSLKQEDKIDNKRKEQLLSASQLATLQAWQFNAKDPNYILNTLGYDTLEEIPMEVASEFIKTTQAQMKKDN